MDVLGKNDDGHGAVQSSDDSLYPICRGAGKCAFRQQTAKAVENLDDIRTGRNLHLQKFGDGGGQFFHQRGKHFRLRVKKSRSARGM